MRQLFFFVVVAVGCSSSSSGGSVGGAANQAQVDESCAKSCAAQKKCTSTVDETTCVNSCKNQAAAFVGKIRADYVTSLDQCSTTASCDKLKDCNNTAKASIAPSSAVQTFCDEAVKKNTECKSGSTDKSVCLENFKIFSDSAIDSARTTCLPKACADYGNCILATVGVKAG